MVHGGDKVPEVNQHSERMLDEPKKIYQDVFNKPVYPIWEHRQPL